MLISDRAAKISSRHGSQSDANDSSLELTGSWWGCYLHSSVPSVAAVYATLRRQSTRFRCRTLASSPSTLHVSWARTIPCTEPRFQEPTRSCFLLAFYTKLSQSSTRVWPVILTSVRPPSRNEARRCEVQKTTEQAPARSYLLKTNTMKTL